MLRHDLHLPASSSSTCFYNSHAYTSSSLTYSCTQCHTPLASANPTLRNATRNSVRPIAQKPPLLCNEARLDTWQHCTASCACAQTQMQMQAQKPRSSRTSQKRPKRYDMMIRRDITRAYSRFTNTRPHVPVHSAVYADFRFPARMNHHLTSDILASRDEPDCVLLPAAVYARWHYYSISTAGCRVGGCRVRRRRWASIMRWHC